MFPLKTMIQKEKEVLLNGIIKFNINNIKFKIHLKKTRL